MTERPGRVTLLAWIWILIGISSVVNSLQGWFATRRVVGAAARSLPATSRAELLALLRPFLTSTWGVAVLIALGCLLVMLGVNLLRLRPWARTGAELVAWLLLALSVSTLLVLGMQLFGGTEEPTDRGFRGTAMLLTTFMTIGAAVRTAMAAVLVWLARCKVTRDACRSPFTPS